MDISKPNQLLTEFISNDILRISEKQLIYLSFLFIGIGLLYEIINRANIQTIWQIS